MAELRIFQAQAEEQIKAARELFLEYAEWLGIDLCFQDFDREVAELGDYAPPGGRIPPRSTARCRTGKSGTGFLSQSIDGLMATSPKASCWKMSQGCSNKTRGH